MPRSKGPSDHRILARYSEVSIPRRLRMPLGGSGYASAVNFTLRSLDTKLSHVDTSDREHPKPTRPYVAATTVSIALTCPDSCDLKSGGCYVGATKTRMMLNRLDRAGEELRAVGRLFNYCPNACEHVNRCSVQSEEWPARNEALVVTINEARRINSAQPAARRPLRLHIGGEVSCILGAVHLGQAARFWRQKDGGPVWTYTKRWSEIPRDAWDDDIAVMASITAKELHRLPEIASQGYAPALLVEEFPLKRAGAKPRRFKTGGVWFTPCKNEVSGGTIKCVECRYCMMADRPLDEGVAFEAHGATRAAEKAKAACRATPGKMVRLKIEGWR